MDAQAKALQQISGQLQKISDTLDVILKATRDANKCGNCRGTGSVMTQLGQDECPRCHGTGTKQ